MIKLALTNRFVNVLAKKLVAKFLAKKIGTDGEVVINELYAIEQDGKLKIKINAELNISSDAAESMIDLL